MTQHAGHDEAASRLGRTGQPAGGGTSPPLAVICIPTFRRPAMLADTLASVAAQATAHPFAVVVVDNDAEGRDGLRLAQEAFDEGTLAGTAVLQPARGNVQAINAAFATAQAVFPAARYLLMIDDDETASPGWLHEMVESAEATGADIVGGPVHPRFHPMPRPGIARHPVFHPSYHRSGPVPMIYGSGNFLIRTAAMTRLARPCFDLSYNFLGGGDCDFFTRCRKAGLRFHWNQEARVEETVPASRQRLGWILKRSLRIGAINLTIDRRNIVHPMAMAHIQAKTAAALALSPFRFARSLLASRSFWAATHPLLVAAGRVSASLGRDHGAYGAKQLS